MTQQIVRVAVIQRLPRHIRTFDYYWDSATPLFIGDFIEVPFRTGFVWGVVVEFPLTTTFKLKTISAQIPIQLLTGQEISFALSVAQELNTNVSNIIRFLVPAFTKKTISLLELRKNFLKNQTTSDILQPTEYHWFSSTETHDQLIADIYKNQQTNSIIWVAPTRARVKKIAQVLTAQGAPPRLYEPTPVRARRALWNSWRTTTPTCVVGTHLGVWLPASARTVCVIDDPTHPAHVQWDGLQFSNRWVLNKRIKYFGDKLILMAHSPDTDDLDWAENFPKLKHWPTVINRQNDEPSQRYDCISPQIFDAVMNAKHPLIFVTHLHDALYHVCRDCGLINPERESALLQTCVKCNGVRFDARGFGGKTVEKFLAGKPAKIVTAAAWEYEDLAKFDCILDLSADFELSLPRYDAEERLWKRIRAVSAGLSADWCGLWYITTMHPDIAAWRVKDEMGFGSWWKDERPLRQRFNQPPFSAALNFSH